MQFKQEPSVTVVSLILVMALCADFKGKGRTGIVLYHIDVPCKSSVLYQIISCLNYIASFQAFPGSLWGRARYILSVYHV